MFCLWDNIFYIYSKVIYTFNAYKCILVRQNNLQMLFLFHVVEKNIYCISASLWCSYHVFSCSFIKSLKFKANKKEKQVKSSINDNRWLQLRTQTLFLIGSIFLIFIKLI